MSPGLIRHVHDRNHRRSYPIRLRGQAVIEPAFHLGTIDVGTEAGRQRGAELSIVFGYREPAGRPCGPFARRMQSGESATDILAPKIAAPFGILELNASELKPWSFPSAPPGQMRKTPGIDGTYRSSFHSRGVDQWDSALRW